MIKNKDVLYDCNCFIKEYYAISYVNYLVVELVLIETANLTEIKQRVTSRKRQISDKLPCIRISPLASIRFVSAIYVQLFKIILV